MSGRRSFLQLLGLALLALSPAGCGGEGPGQRPRGPSVQAPAAVKETVLKEAGKGAVDAVRRTEENGATVYEADIVRDDVARTITVAEDGTLLSREMSFDELPAAAQATVKGLLRGGKAGEVYWGNENGDRVYWVEVIREETKRSYTLALDGTLLAEQVSLEETPEPVQKAVRERLGTARLRDIDKAGLDSGETRYDVTMIKDGKPRLFSVGPDGKLLSEQVLPEEVPAEALKAIKQAAGDKRIVLIERCEDEGTVYFEAAYLSADVKRTCLVTQAGKLVSQEVPYADVPAAVQKTVGEKAPGAATLKAEKIADGAAVYYEIRVRQDGKTSTLEIGEDGKSR